MKRFSNILLVADTALDKPVALRRAMALAEVNQAALTIVDVVEELPEKSSKAGAGLPYTELLDIAISEKRRGLERLSETIQGTRVNVSTEVLIGKAFLEIIRKTIRDKHDLVLKCIDPKRAWQLAKFGSTDMQLMRKCPCPVWILKGDDKPRYKSVVAAVDNDPESAATEALNRQILELSTSLAIAESSELHIVHAWSLVFESYFRSGRASIDDAEIDAMIAGERDARMQWLDELVNSFCFSGNKEAVDYIKPHLHVIKGDAMQVVPAKSKELNADVLVMGTVARTGVSGLLMGNTAESILMNLDCSVLTVKPPGFVSPVLV